MQGILMKLRPLFTEELKVQGRVVLKSISCDLTVHCY